LRYIDEGLKVCAVGAEPGWTKEMQAVQVERGIKILDSPGVVFESQASADQNVLLRNVLKVDAMDDPIAVAELIFQRTTGTRIHSIYGLQVPLDPDFQKFLVQLALTTGKLSKAGVPDVEAAARTVIRDWNSHKIPFSSEPPKVHSSSVPGQMDGEQDIGDSAVVNNFAKPFELEGLWEADAMDEDR
jgi:nuclear GTP-binding protein